MKKIFCLVLFVSMLACNVHAGGPVTVRELSEVKPVEKAKMTLIEYAYDDFSKVAKHFTLGIGWGGNPMIGYVEKDGFGYPKCEYGVNTLLGIGVTWFSGQPTEAQIKEALARVRSEKGAYVKEKDVPSLVREAVGIQSLNYLEVGTVLLIVPEIEIGTMWILNDSTRTRFGFGFPTIISFGINWDF